MTRLFPSTNSYLVNIDSHSLVVREWIKTSVSRIWYEHRWVYPITELQELFDFCEAINEDIEVPQSIWNAYQTFQEKKRVLALYKKGKSFNGASHLFTGKLYDYQGPVVAQILFMHKYLLALEVGLGKTVISVAAFCKLRDIKPVKVLIVCESNQIHKPWLETIYKQTRLKNVLVIEGDASEREKQIKFGAHNRKTSWLWLTSYETIRIEQDKLPKDWDVIIYDEITKIKNISTKTSKALLNFQADYVWGLSATPIKNTYLDLYGVMKAIQPYLFTTKNNFINHYLSLDYFNRPVRIKKEQEPLLLAKTSPWYTQLVRADLARERAVHLKTYRVALTSLQTLKFKEITDKIKTMDTTVFEQGTRMRQICNTVKVFEEYKDRNIHETTNKVRVLEEILQNTIKKEKKRVVVFSFFKTVIKELNNYFKNKYITRAVDGQTKKTCTFPKQMVCRDCSKYQLCGSIKKHIWDFVDGDTKLLLGTDTLSRAHNLRTCDTIVNFDLPWTAADLKQRIGRIDRVDNPAPELYIYNIVTEKTVEEKIIKIIERKEKQASKILPKYSVKISKLGASVRTKRV